MYVLLVNRVDWLCVTPPSASCTGELSVSELTDLSAIVSLYIGFVFEFSSRECDRSRHATFIHNLAKLSVQKMNCPIVEDAHQLPPLRC
ncbi:Hypothetical predicted protein [Cloeon dipterum]|uniref:Uncharacterized protein n=1 Tax=Cloeon dipterum TaxID=197152 RepID=A0A8S1CJL2_9INSE|nr:Hypothetical predicted protein [Cloeon dipterum]